MPYERVVKKTTAHEVANYRLVPENPEDAILCGDFSDIACYFDAPSFYAQYVPSYLITLCSQLGCTDVFTVHYFLVACASRLGKPLNCQELAQECDISLETVDQWITLLEKNHALYRINPYIFDEDDGPPTRYLYFYNTGIAASLLGITSPQELTACEQYESLSHNYILNQLITTTNFSRNHTITWFKEHAHDAIKFVVVTTSTDKKSPIFIDIKVALHYQNWVTKKIHDPKLPDKYRLQPHPDEQQHDDTYFIHRGTTNFSAGLYLFYLSWESVHFIINPSAFYESETNLHILYLMMLYLNKNDLNKICQYNNIPPHDSIPKKAVIERILCHLLSHNAEKMHFIMHIINNVGDYKEYRTYAAGLIEEIFVPLHGPEGSLYSGARRSLPIRIMLYYFPCIYLYDALLIANKILCENCRTDKTCNYCNWRNNYDRGWCND